MNIVEKHKACLKIAELLFGLPNDEVEAIMEIISARKKLHGQLYGATVNAKSGQTAERVKLDLRANANQARDWGSAPITTPTQTDSVVVQSGNGF